MLYPPGYCCSTLLEHMPAVLCEHALCCSPFDYTLSGHASVPMCAMSVLWRIPVGWPSKATATLPKEYRRGSIATTAGGYGMWQRLGKASQQWGCICCILCLLFLIHNALGSRFMSLHLSFGYMGRIRGILWHYTGWAQHLTVFSPLHQHPKIHLMFKNTTCLVKNTQMMYVPMLVELLHFEERVFYILGWLSHAGCYVMLWWEENSLQGCWRSFKGITQPTIPHW